MNTTIRQCISGLLLAACFELTARAQVQNMDGYVRVMTEKFTIWKKAHDDFDRLFGAQVEKRLAVTRQEAASTDLCRTDQKAAIDALRASLKDQVDAQRVYFSEHAKAAKSTVDAQTVEQANIGSQDRQRLELLKQAETELAAFKANLVQLEKSEEVLRRSQAPAAPAVDRSSLGAASQTAEGPTVTGVATAGNPPSGDVPSTPADAGANPDSTSAAADLETAKKRLKDAIVLSEEKVDALRAMGQNIELARASRRRIVADSKATIDASDRSMDSLEVQRLFWGSYYDMRATQVIEFCGQAEMKSPLRLVIPPH